MADTRHKNRNYPVTTDDGSLWLHVQQAQLLAALMDIRDELQSINRILAGIPGKIERIAHNTSKPRRRRKPKLERKAT